MALPYYQGGDNQSLNPAYSMLLQAALAKAQAMGSVLNGVGDAADTYTRGRVANRELDIREQGQRRSLDLEQERVGLERQRLGLQAGSRDAFHRAMAHIQGLPDGYQHDPGPAGPAFQGRTVGTSAVRQQPMSASALLSGGGPQAPGQIDPADLAAMLPEDAAHAISIQNTLADNAARDEARQQKQQAAQQESQTLNRLLQNEVTAKNVDPADVPAIQAHFALGSEEGKNAGLALMEKGRAKREKIGAAGKQYKELETYINAHPEDEVAAKYAGSLPSLKTAAANDPELFASLYKTASEDVFKTKPEKQPHETDYTKDLPKDSLLRAPGTYAIDPKTGDLVMPQAERAQVRMLARKALSQDPLFNGPLAASYEIAPDAKGAEDFKASQTKALRDMETNILQAQGWTEAAKDSGLPFGEGQPKGESTGAGSSIAGGKSEPSGGAGGPAPASKPVQPPAQPPSAKGPDPLLQLTPEQRKQAEALHAAGDREGLRKFLIGSRSQNAVGGPSAISVDWEKRNPKPKKSWFSSPEGPMMNLGIFTYEDALSEWEAAKKGDKGFGRDTPWAGMALP